MKKCGRCVEKCVHLKQISTLNWCEAKYQKIENKGRICSSYRKKQFLDYLIAFLNSLLELLFN